MGEKAAHSKENGVSNGHDDLDEEMNEAEDFEDMTVEEFNAINNQLDALNSALDDIEQKNDDIHAQLLQLLESNRQMRKQMQETNESTKAAAQNSQAQQ
ncbi:hypothetical protein Trydic_g232 [Trypoxylus dichotomus]